jgi:acyl transferase domain-containing protein
MRFDPVAVVGQSCLLPGANGVAELWRALHESRDVLSAAPPGRWGLDKARVLSAHVGSERDCAFTDRGGYVAGFETLFDPSGFALPPELLLPLDPLFHFALHGAREALRDAGHDGSGARVGLILGNLSFPSDRSLATRKPSGAASPLPTHANRFQSGLPAHLTARALGLGPGRSRSTPRARRRCMR